jgi:uncharacterized protein (TIGR02001 family)
MKKTLLAVTLAALTSGAATSALAADPKAPEPDFEISGNFGLFSDYRFRGISQSERNAAVQGGFDLAHTSGFYLGTWGSSVSNWANANGSGLEIDVYGGYSTEIAGGIGFDIGVLHYNYPGATPTAPLVDGNTDEVYLGVSYGPLSYKYSHIVSSNWFTTAAKSGSQYHDLSAEFPLNDKVTLSAHYGVTKVKGVSDFNGFNDYKIGVSYSIGSDYSIGLDYVGTGGLTQAEKDGYFTQDGSGAGKKLYESGAVISLSKTF